MKVRSPRDATRRVLAAAAPGRRRPPDSEWLGVDWDASTHDVLFDGRRVRFTDHGAGPALVLVHGLGGSWQNWLENIPALAAAGHRVVAVDLPGFGLSDPLPAPAAIAGHVRVLRRLVERLGLGAPVVVGHSMGALVATHLAIAHPDALSGLIVVDGGTLAISGRRLGALIGAFTLFDLTLGLPGVTRVVVEHGPLRRLLLRGFVGRPGALSPQLAAEVIPGARAPGFNAAVRAAAAAVATVDPAAITCPTLVLWGERDRIVPVAEARRLAAEIPSARLLTLPGVGHCPMFEEPTAFNRAVVDFAASVCANDRSRTG